MKRKLLIGMVLFLSSVFLIGCSSKEPYVECDEEEISIGIYGDLPDLNKYCQFYDGLGETIKYTEDMIEFHDIDATKPGFYTMRIQFTNDKDNTLRHTFMVEVIDTRIYQSPTGFRDLRDFSEEVRMRFISSVEKYLLDTMSGGIPIYSSGNYSLISDRVLYPLDNSIPYIGFGDMFGTLLEDDSTVIMYDGVSGNVGEYTYRMALPENPLSFNQYTYDNHIDATYMKMVSGSLYQYTPNLETGGYTITPALASGFPEPLNSSQFEGSKFMTWNIPIREDLTWSYYQDERPNYITDDTIDAHDFENTLRIALDERWYRALSGPYDFIDFYQGIDKLYDYSNGLVSWDEVGFKAIDDQTLQITFLSPATQNEVISWINDFFYLSPIHTQMYEHLGVNYGTSPETIAYHGPYQIQRYIEDSVVLLQRNSHYPLSDMYHYTNISVQIIEEEYMLDLYDAGRLDFCSVEFADLDTYWGDDNLLVVPSYDVYKLNINGFGTTENLQEIFPDSTYVPAPILANENFRKALYFAIDREYLVQSEMQSGFPMAGLFTNAYVGNSETGVPYRNSELGMSVLEEFSPETLGYNAEQAHELFVKAVEEVLYTGSYEAGTEDNPTIITLSLYYMDGDTQQGLFDAIENSLEQILVDEEHHVQIDIVGTMVPFPQIYSDYIRKGEYDLAFGGISVCTLCQSHIFSEYFSDNRENITLNYGIDSNEPNVVVEYKHPAVYDNVVERWSIDAIAAALEGEVFIFEGELLTLPNVDILDKTTDSFVLSIEDFRNIPFDDVTYSIQYYDNGTDGYVDLTNYSKNPFVDENSSMAGMQVQIEGLDSYMYYRTTNDETVYQGDYRIVVYYSVEEDREISFILPWIKTETLLTINSDTVTNTDITLNVSPFDSVNREITDVRIYNPVTGTFATATIDATDFSELHIFNLTKHTTYVIVFMLDDGSEFYYMFQTKNLS